WRGVSGIPGRRASDALGRSGAITAGAAVMMVKICGITNQDDAQAAVEAGASALGFNFYRDSPRYISPTGASLIAEKLPAGVLKVGVFVDDTPDAIARIALQAGLDVAQLHGEAECPAMRIWRACPIRDSIEFDC